ncbi:MAG: FAD binding domain-containing protein, partial [Hyphomicrobiales bacterium]|nr:FAD binding domain-containing protein [Hyphomicrobiales bacterium]
MTAMTNPLAYEAPETLQDALDVLAGGDVTILAGGTDLMVQAESGRVSFEKTLLNIRRVKGLGGISEESGEIRIGALTTITDLLESELLAAKAPILVVAADHFASAQIRNAGTIGGNICNASP